MVVVVVVVVMVLMTPFLADDHDTHETPTVVMDDHALMMDQSIPETESTLEMEGDRDDDDRKEMDHFPTTWMAADHEGVGGGVDEVVDEVVDGEVEDQDEIAQTGLDGEIAQIDLDGERQEHGVPTIAVQDDVLVAVDPSDHHDDHQVALVHFVPKLEDDFDVRDKKT